MGRLILAVVLGYAVMFVAVFLTFSGAYVAMGTERAFQPGSYEPTAVWVTLSFFLGFLAAVAGGYTCVAVARKMPPALALAALVIAIGLASAGAMMMRPPDARPTVRTGEVSNLEAMQNARPPLWVAFLNPFLGAAGVLLGARLKGAPPA